MYNVDGNDRVIMLDTAPRCSGGAPMPSVVADDDRLLLAYIVSERDPAWTGATAELVTSESPGKAIAIVAFVQPYAHLFGPPNDEAFPGHPLAERGLTRYAVAEVERSSWIRGLVAMNAVHPLHKPEHFAAYRHFIFAFHDSTFECVAVDFSVEMQRGSMRDVVQQMARMTG